MREAMRAASVWPEMPFMRGPQGAERLRVWLPRHRQIRAETASRRERVLAHSWAAKRLCDIMRYARAEQWTGYVPPAGDQRGRRNDSPVRKALIELLRDVYRYDRGEDLTEEAA